MKNIQTRILKILLITSAILFSVSAHARDLHNELSKADSLFIKKQYTQSFELYKSLHQGGHYSPAMLLKMAFIQEGLGHIGLSLYYLNLYYLASGDTQALDKLQELASKNRLEGYEHSETARILFAMHKYGNYVSTALAALAILLLIILYRIRKRETKPLAIGIFTAAVIVLLAIQINVSYELPTAIIADPDTYLMSGPSGGADVVTRVDEGHKLKIKDKKDVWLKVEWLDKEVYIKENQVLKVEL